MVGDAQASWQVLGEPEGGEVLMEEEAARGAAVGRVRGRRAGARDEGASSLLPCPGRVGPAWDEEGQDGPRRAVEVEQARPVRVRIERPGEAAGEASLGGDRGAEEDEEAL
jgi:hypothetical protein